jgi:hypothetical protein
MRERSALMFKGILIIFFSFILVFLSSIVQPHDRQPNHIMSTTLICKVNFAPRIKRSFRISPDGRHTAYVAKEGDKMVVVVDGKKEKPYDKILSGTPIFSPDNRFVAYAARSENQWFVVADGKEGKRYDEIIKNNLTFSPDSEHLAYAAKSGNGWFVVLDGKEGIKYGSDTYIVNGSLVIDSSNSLRYLYVQDCYVYRTEETID